MKKELVIRLITEMRNIRKAEDLQKEAYELCGGEDRYEGGTHHGLEAVFYDIIEDYFGYVTDEYVSSFVIDGFYIDYDWGEVQEKGWTKKLESGTEYFAFGKYNLEELESYRKIEDVAEFVEFLYGLKD